MVVVVVPWKEQLYERLVCQALVLELVFEISLTLLVDVAMQQQSV